MRWPFRRMQAGCPSDEAVDSAAEATRALRDVDALTGRAEDVTRRLRETRERNHFGVAIERAIKGV